MWKTVAAGLLMFGALAGCTSDGEVVDETPDGSAPEEVSSVTVPPERLTPFCQAMIDLDQRLPDDVSVDTTAMIIDAYRAALPDVPAAIAVEFAAVLDALERGTVATLPPTVPTTAPPSTISAAATSIAEATGTTGPDTTVPFGTFDEEGYLPDDTPASRVNEYIDFACRGTQNNPGPPPTQPEAPLPTTPSG